MKLPTLNEIATSRSIVDVFKGYNHNLRIGDGEFYDMQNLTSTHYPILSPRSKRGTYVEAFDPQCMIAKDSLCYLDGSYFVMNEYRVDLSLKEYHSAQMVSMGAYVVIFTKDADGNAVDNVWINTRDISQHGSVDAEYVSPEGTSVTFELCQISGATYDSAPHSPTEPSEPNNMDYWIDTSSTPHTLKQWSETQEMWISIATTYIKISAPGIGVNFEQYDGVKISGVESQELSDLNSTMAIWAKGDDYIVVVGILDAVTSQTAPITVRREIPNMDFVVESENRLWGCRYGVASNGEVVNEIYACKLGDFKNWNCFMGISTDSYAASCGTDGQFTGAITHLGYPLFFKENCLHKVYGNYPANYQIQTTTCRGVQKGSGKSLAIVNEVLYYKSRNAVCAYDGSLPTEISYALGEAHYSSAVACGHNNKYYISMCDNLDEYSLFVYDTQKGLWHKEDNLAVKDFCSCRNELYYISKDGTDIKTIFGSGTVDQTPVTWNAESGVIDMYTPDKKYISGLNIRLSLNLNSKVYIYAQYDSCGEWEHLCTLEGINLRSFSIPLRPKRCDHFRLKIEGEGEAKIYSITKTLEQGSDV